MRIARWLVAASLALPALGVIWLLERPYSTTTGGGEVVDSPRIDATPQQEPGESAHPGAGRGREPDAGEAPAPVLVAEMAVQIPAASTPLTRTHNVLLIGLDRRYGVRRGGRTDTLIIAAFDEETDHLALVGVPRDLWVQIPDEEPNRINTVYGLALRSKRDPLELLERVISDTLSVPIAHSLAIDLNVFETVIDEIGGVTVDVPCPIIDDFVDPRVDGGRRVLRLDAGPQHLDGPTAAMFIRSRHGRSDWSRARRQQRVLRAMHAKLASIDGLLHAPALLARVEGSLRTDMSRLQLLGLIRRVLEQDPSKIHGIVLDTRQTQPFRNEKNWSVLLPKPDAIAERLATVFTASAPGTEPKGAVCPPAEAALRSARTKRRKSAVEPPPSAPPPAGTPTAKAGILQPTIDPDHD